MFPIPSTVPGGASDHRGGGREDAFRHQPGEDLSIEHLSAWFGSQPVKVEILGGGRNSRVYGVHPEQGEPRIIKAYFRSKDDPRDRLGTEFQALEYLWTHGLRCLPEPLARNAEAGLGLMSYIEGEPLLQPRMEEIDEVISFVSRLKELSRKPDAVAFQGASEAHFSLEGVCDHIQCRLDRLTNLDGDTEGQNDLGRFLEDRLLPAWRMLCDGCFDLARRSHLSFDSMLPVEDRILSPSDFGFHNTLRRAGQVVFLDFEYFGWDDPAKLISDFLLHPGMALPPELSHHFAEQMIGLLGGHELALRTRVAYPLFGIKWCTILLNEFLPDALQRRSFSDRESLPTEIRRAQQLVKCERKLRQVLDEHAHFTCFDASF